MDLAELAQTPCSTLISRKRYKLPVGPSLAQDRLASIGRQRR
jgi:hypothetical protein